MASYAIPLKEKLQTNQCSEKFISLIESKAKVNAETASDLFDQLPPIKPSELIGSWSGGFFDTGHPVGDKLVEIKWVGKEFESLDEVDPVIVERDGQRASWGQWGRASVRLSSQKDCRLISAN